VQIAIICLCLLGILLGGGILMTLDNHRARGRMAVLEREVNAMNGRINAVARESKILYERLVEDLWRRGSAEIDQEIERARARGRGF
jgi:hypothetical protein